LTVVERNARIQKNKKRLHNIYIGATVMGIILALSFIVFTGVLMILNCDTSSCGTTSQFTSVIGVLNILLWLLLMFSTIKFILQIRQRFGTQYSQATWKLTFVLVIFSLAFLIRGTFDIWVTLANPQQSTLGMGNEGFALFVGSFYIMCEVVPLFVVFLQHRKDFGRCEYEKLQESLIQSDVKNVLKNSLTGSTGASLEQQTETAASIVVQNVVEPRTTEVLRNVIDDGMFDMKWEPGLLDLRMSALNNLR
jgi:amino acid permease